MIRFLLSKRFRSSELTVGSYVEAVGKFGKPFFGVVEKVDGAVYIRIGERKTFTIPPKITFAAKLAGTENMFDIQHRAYSFKNEHKIKLDALYGKMYDHKNGFTTNEAAKEIFQEPEIDILHELAVFYHMMENSTYFDIHSRFKYTDELSELRYMCRREEEKDFMQMLNDKSFKRDDVYESFVKKVRAMLSSKQNNVSFLKQDLPFIKGLAIFAISRENPFDLSYKNFTKRVLSRAGFEYEDIDKAAKNLIIKLNLWKDWDNVNSVFAIDCQNIWQNIEHFRKRNEDDSLFNDSSLLDNGLASTDRHDFGDLPVYTIDSETTRDVDDGISVEVKEGSHPWFHINISDFSSEIATNSPLFERILNYPSSIYFVGKTFNMLPESFVQKLSIEPGRENKVITISVSLDESGQLVDYKIRRGLVKNIKKIPYSQADQFLIPRNQYFVIPPGEDPNWNYELLDEVRASSISKEDQKNLDIMEKYSYLHAQQRLKGSLKFLSIPRPSIILESDFKFPDLFSGKRRLNESHPEMSTTVALPVGSTMIVQEFMTIASEVVAKFVSERQIPFLYNTQDNEIPPDSCCIDNHPVYMTIKDSLKLVQGMKKSSLSVVPGRFNALNLDHYSQITSPIRRANDAINHMQLTSALFDSKPVFSETNMNDFIDQIGNLISISKRLGNSDKFHWILSILKQNNYEDVFTGYVISSNENFTTYRVFLKEIGLTVLIYPRNLLRPGEKLIGTWIKVGTFNDEKNYNLISFKEI